MERGMPEGLEYWRVDEVAESLDYTRHLTEEKGRVLYRKLWGFLNEAENPTPMGGDGSEGTVESPDALRSLSNDDKMGHWWGSLEEEEQDAIIAAFAAEMEMGLV